MKILKWTLLALLAVLVLFVAYGVARIDDVNARVAEELRSNPAGPRAARTMLLTLADGRMYPVNYLWEGDRVYIGIDGRWWREFLGDGQPVSMEIKGASLRGHAVAKLDDPEFTADIFSRLRPTAPAWLPTWLNGKLVIITLRE